MKIKNEGIIKSYIELTNNNVFNNKNMKEINSITQYKIIYQNDDFLFVKINPQTGKKHQVFLYYN